MVVYIGKIISPTSCAGIISLPPASYQWQNAAPRTRKNLDGGRKSLSASPPSVAPLAKSNVKATPGFLLHLFGGDITLSLRSNVDRRWHKKHISAISSENWHSRKTWQRYRASAWRGHGVSACISGSDASAWRLAKSNINCGISSKRNSYQRAWRSAKWRGQHGVADMAAGEGL